METKHTKGEWIPQFFKGDINVCIGVMVKSKNGYSQRICDTILPSTDEEYIEEREEIEANAKLIAEAGTVANETGKTPRQLADENKELLEALIELLKSHETLNFDKTGDIFSTEVEQKAINAINKATK